MFNPNNFRFFFQKKYLNLLEKDRLYLAHHKVRYLHTVKLLSQYLKTDNFEVLDVGTSNLTFIIKDLFPGINLSTVDLTNKYKKECLKNQINFYKVNINNCVPKLNISFDIIIFSEVLEHLTRDHFQILNDLKNLLKKEGILYIQTPNILSLNNRINFLRGNDIRPKRKVFFKKMNDPEAHYYEYKIDELSKLVKSVNGLKVLNVNYANYYDNIQTALTYKNPKFLYFFPALFYCIMVKLYPPFQRGIELIAKNEI